MISLHLFGFIFVSIIRGSAYSVFAPHQTFIRWHRLNRTLKSTCLNLPLITLFVMFVMPIFIDIIPNVIINYVVSHVARVARVSLAVSRRWRYASEK